MIPAHDDSSEEEGSDMEVDASVEVGLSHAEMVEDFEPHALPVLGEEEEEAKDDELGPEREWQGEM